MKSLLLLLFIMISLAGLTQIPEYNMTDSLVNDCQGYLFDSGGPDQGYMNNEDFTFTIETEGEITLSFLNQFCIEEQFGDVIFDNLIIHNGLTTADPILASLNGSTLPPNIIIPSGIVTLHFTSDENAFQCGWQLFWDTEVTPPIPPVITITNPACNSNTLNVQFSTSQLCNLILDAEITVDSDPSFVDNIFPECTDDEATEAIMNLENVLDYNCDYTVNFHIGIPDQCDSIWYFDIASSFSVLTCPVNAEIIALSDTICLGSSTEISVDNPALGCHDYTYVWNNGLPSNIGPHVVSPNITTEYTCLVTEENTGLTANLSYTLTVIDFEITDDEIFLCESSDEITLVADAPGGTWSGDGIIDEILGVFSPNEAEVGENVITYSLGGGCSDDMSVFVTPINAGGTLAACPGSGTFQLQPEPLGGTWEGDFVTADGFFDPSTPGSYILTYTLNQCTDDLTMNVAELFVADLDTLCQSFPESQFDFTPYGGLWTSPDSETLLTGQSGGYFDPGEVGSIDPAGESYDFIYTIFGCSDTIDLFIKPISIGNTHYLNSCPSQDSFVPSDLSTGFSPSGGIWEIFDEDMNPENSAALDPITGEYFPTLLEEATWYYLLYTAPLPNGCTDTIYMYNKYTEIGIDSLFFCEDADSILFNSGEPVFRNPWGGDWSGGQFDYISFEDEEDEDLEGFYFFPELTGVGDHMIYYENNSCTDSLAISIFPLEIAPDSVEYCSTEEVQDFGSNIPAGSSWTGPGVIDSENGLFDPGSSEISEEDFFIFWDTPAGCNDSIFIHIEQFLQAEISDLDPIYCFEDTFEFIAVFPEDENELGAEGTISGNGVDTDAYNFNPSNAGEGIHDIIYNYEGFLCSSVDTFQVTVNPELIISLTASDTIICSGSSSIITVNSVGGQPSSLLDYDWSDASFSPISENTAIPNQTTTYTVEIDDNCSDVATGSIEIVVLPPIQVSIFTNDTVCFAEPGFATGTVNSPGEFDTSWGFNSEFDVDTIFVEAGTSSQFNVIDTIQGCEFDTVIYTPSYTPISALFTVNPNEDCIPYILNELTFIDLSEHGVTGYWDFGNGDLQTYNPEENPVITFESNIYTINLYIENEGDCPDSSQLEICILPSSRIFIPDVFSPNGDGINDSLYVRGQGIQEMDMKVYDQYGRMVFKTKDPEDGWDGNSFGLKLPSGIYICRTEILLQNGERIELHGDITLVR